MGGKTTAVEPETKAAAIADLISGESVSATAKKYSLSRTTVTRWRDQSGASRSLVSAAPETTKQHLLALVTDLTRANLNALTAIAEHVQDKAWLGKQSAHDLAILYGVQFDKLARLVAALAGDGPPEQQPGSGRSATGRPVGGLPPPP